MSESASAETTNVTASAAKTITRAQASAADAPRTPERPGEEHARGEDDGQAEDQLGEEPGVAHRADVQRRPDVPYGLPRARPATTSVAPDRARAGSAAATSSSASAVGEQRLDVARSEPRRDLAVETCPLAPVHPPAHEERGAEQARARSASPGRPWSER